MVLSMDERARRIRCAREEIANGGTVSSAAKRLGVHNGKLHTFLARYAPDILAASKASQAKRQDEINARREEVRNLFDQHKRIGVVAGLLNTSHDTVRRDLKALGIDHSKISLHGRPRQVIDINEAIEMAERGVSLEDAAKHFGLSVSGFTAILRRDVGESWSEMKKCLTKSQQEDVNTLVMEGGYSRAEAIEIVTRPRVRLSALPREMRA